MRELPRHPRHRRPLCSPLRCALLLLRCGSRIQMAHGSVFKPNVLYEALCAPAQHRWTFRWIKIPLNPSPLSASSLPAFSLCQRRCRPLLRSGPSGDCRSERRPSWRHWDGEHQKTALRAGSTSPPAGSNREHGFHLRIPKILPIQLTASPAQHNQAALSPWARFSCRAKKKV